MAWKPYTGRGGRYQYYLKYKGVRKEKVVATHEEGKRWIVATKAQIDADFARKAEPPVLMFSAASADYLEAMSLWQTATTVAEKLAHYTELAEFVGGDFPLAALTVEDARRFIAQAAKDKGHKGANRRLQKISALWAFFLKEGKIPSNPWRMIPPLPEERTLPAVPTVADMAALLLAAKEWEKDFLVILAHTGARVGEIRELAWEDVNLERSQIVVWTKKRKGSNLEPRAVGLTAPTKEILARRWKARKGEETHVFVNPLTGGPWDRNHASMKRLAEDLCTRAGLKTRYTLRAIRHYVAQRLADSGKASLIDAQRLLGHQRATTTDLYLRSLTPDVSRVASVLESEIKVRPRVRPKKNPGLKSVS